MRLNIRKERLDLSVLRGGLIRSAEVDRLKYSKGQKIPKPVSGPRWAVRPQAGTPPKDATMAKLIFINLPVGDLKRATAFYQAIGAVKNGQFCDDTASCMVLSDTIHVMLMTHDKYRQFTTKKIADAKTTSQVLLCLSADSRTEVDDVVRKAGSAGGVIDPSPVDEYDFMYGRSFEDPDGHLWGVNWMNFEACPPSAPN
jgi:uncharacterized protein